MTAAWPRVIAHADMDAFYASVEQLDDPTLRGRPLIVGPNSARGVVLTASYEARPFGVGSAMPMARARRLCPEALIVPPRFERYSQVSKIIMDLFGDFSPSVEALSLDEAFLDMTGSDKLFGAPEAIGRKLKAAIREATAGLTASVGISGTKYVAKVASGHRKPDGLTIVPPDEARAWLAPQPVKNLWGAGPKTAGRLEALGLEHDWRRRGVRFPLARTFARRDRPPLHCARARRRLSRGCRHARIARPQLGAHAERRRKRTQGNRRLSAQRRGNRRAALAAALSSSSRCARQAEDAATFGSSHGSRR